MSTLCHIMRPEMVWFQPENNLFLGPNQFIFGPKCFCFFLNNVHLKLLFYIFLAVKCNVILSDINQIRLQHTRQFKQKRFRSRVQQMFIQLILMYIGSRVPCKCNLPHRPCLYFLVERRNAEPLPNQLRQLTRWFVLINLFFVRNISSCIA